MIKELQQDFKEQFQCEPEKAFFSPSRINLIGEHIDYNGGKVLPAAITLGTYGVASKRDDSRVGLYSENFQEDGILDLENLSEKQNNWTDYVAGMLLALGKAGYPSQGFNLLIKGNIPNGAGLSSSASLEILVGQVVNYLFYKGEIPGKTLALCGKATENDYIGVQSGIMDQFIIALGKENHAMLLDTETLEYEYRPLELEDAVFLIMHTKKRRKLKDSKYNERRKECEEILQGVQIAFPVEHLCALPQEKLPHAMSILNRNVLRNRLQHVVEENGRVKAFAEALGQGDLVEAGRLLSASHASLRDLYKVTGPELDTLVEEAEKIPGCYGARMTGGGFGGCAIALVKKDAVDQLIKEVAEAYEKRIGYAPEFFSTKISDGAKEIPLASCGETDKACIIKRIVSFFKRH